MEQQRDHRIHDAEDSLVFLFLGLIFFAAPKIVSQKNAASYIGQSSNLKRTAKTARDFCWIVAEKMLCFFTDCKEWVMAP